MMQKAATRPADPRPPLQISDTDHDIIARLALGIEGRSPDLSGLLLDEIERASILPARDLPADVVALGSEVEYLDDASGTVRRVRLVMPAEADIEEGRISILTPVGAGLIGMRAGHEIDWPCPDGRPRTLRILKVDQRS
ncbi:nucleoside diphosphate kinase regulator [Sphingosinicella rhizophila]|uniref:Nucleoside diphosphate kinase regulator n=1 Tax=Sphingosinicella rhizophila TaxID=3050082 RepID=A0ABU3Q9R3_9SPHN|nr:nucleoside diphosphate kinase regulator [Sphingosinicella sp. GR2756]MDT9600150.1 nucleoside diphosphate kinase regulator [Sphingosinicella sp. GR2756]